ncbi:MAG: hypothetical protein HFE97_12415 [Oscillospiraceae bacterium]|nr:hypothetical protein [Oscillospiraceae bacterium]
MSKMEPLAVEEQEMAEQYFYLVDKFLKREHLDPNEYYDVVIFGYLQAIQRECRNPNPPEKKNIYGLIEVCMKRAVLMEWRRQYQDMRKSDRESLSLDCVPADTDNGEFSLYDVVADTRQNTVVQVETQDLTERVLAVATPREREAINLACLGYKTHEIAEILGIARNTASRILYNFRVKAKAVRDDREVIRSLQWARDKKKVQARNRAYREAHREELLEKQRACNHAHPEKIREKKRVYRAAHLEESRAKEQSYRDAHREEINARRRARRAAEKQVCEQEKRRPRCCEHQGRQVAVAI